MHIGHIDSAFQSQEYIAQLILQDPHDVQRIVSIPKVSPDDDKGSIDEGCWLFEQLRCVAFFVYFRGSTYATWCGVVWTADDWRKT